MVIATHADEALSLIENPTEEERKMGTCRTEHFELPSKKNTFAFTSWDKPI